MRQSARQLESSRGLGALLLEGLTLSAGAALRNPVAVGGTTAFLVALGFVSANALWYQPHFHQGAFFSTRAPAPQAIEYRDPEPQTMLRQVAPQPQLLDREPAPDPVVTETTSPAEAEQPAIAGDRMVARVQTILKGLDLYKGEVDGLTGPQTDAAIATYQRIVGLSQTAKVDDALLAQLGISEPVPANVDPQQVAALPAVLTVPDSLPTPAPRGGQQAEQASVPAAAAPDPRVVRIQAGLRAFGNDGIELDGKVGDRTRRAIEEFQSLFGLPITGEPDEQVFAKMREIGLTD